LGTCIVLVLYLYCTCMYLYCTCVVFVHEYFMNIVDPTVNSTFLNSSHSFSKIIEKISESNNNYSGRHCIYHSSSYAVHTKPSQQYIASKDTPPQAAYPTTHSLAVESPSLSFVRKELSSAVESLPLSFVGK